MNRLMPRSACVVVVVKMSAWRRACALTCFCARVRQYVRPRACASDAGSMSVIQVERRKKEDEGRGGGKCERVCGGRIYMKDKGGKAN